MKKKRNITFWEIIWWLSLGAFTAAIIFTDSLYVHTWLIAILISKLGMDTTNKNNYGH